VGHRAGLDVYEKSEIICPCLESNRYTSVGQFAAQSQYRLLSVVAADGVRGILSQGMSVG